MEFPEVHPLVIIWTAILLLVFIVSLFKYLSRRSKYQLLERLAEKGQQLTPEMLQGITNGGKSKDDKNPISGGIFLMCIGVALAVFFWGMNGWGNPMHGDSWLPVIGIFPFMVGLARLLGGLFEGRSSK